MLCRATGLCLALVSALACAAGASAAGVQHFFFAPGVTTSCEMGLNMPKLGTYAYCQTYPHTESAMLNPAGHVSICHGIKCIGNPPDQVPTLEYGAWLDAGPLRCTSEKAGVRCVVKRTGHGFLIAPTSIKRI